MHFLLQTLLTAGSTTHAVATGCGKPLPVKAGSTTKVAIQSGGIDRDFLLHVPSAYDGKNPVPMIFSFHGRGKDAQSQKKLSQFYNPDFNPDAISLYPNAVPNETGVRQWTGDPEAPKSIDDIAFTIDMIHHMSENYCIAPKRIFASGKSNGAGLVSLLACDPHASALIAAFAPVSAANYLLADGKAPPCNPSRSPIPLLEFHGWEDTTILYEGGNNTRDDGVTPPIPEWIDGWATRDGCTVSKNQTATLCSPGRPVVTKYSWDCKGVEGAVQHYNISNLKHDWPSIDGNSETDRKTCFNATTLIMDFFGKHELPG